jgi:hypothetical protein
MSANKKMKLQVGHSIVGTFPRLNYRWWYAIAEFVDNATQSYFDNKVKLEELYLEQNNGLKITITRGKDLFRISDNAFGMNEKTLERALVVAQPPPIPKGTTKHGRSRYGMGMKTSSGWIGNVLSIRTTELGSGIELSTEINWEQVSAGNIDFEVSSRVVDKKACGTIIEVSGLHNPMVGRTINKCKQYLESMYRIDIRDKILCLEWDGKSLKAYGTADSEFQTKPDGSPWKKQLKDLNTTSNSSGKNAKKVEGWVGILGKSTAKRVKAGFSIFHNNRQVIGYPESWRPEPIFGDWGSNDLINQRVTGELHLDDFEVSHTKDGIYWRFDEEREVGKLIENQIKDLVAQAKLTYKSQTHGSAAKLKAYEKAALNLKEEISSEVLNKEVDLAAVEPPASIEIVQAQSEASIESAKSKNKPAMKVELSQYTIELYLENQGIDKPYYVNSSYSDEKETLFVVVNLDHPWFENIDPDVVQLNLQHVVYDAISEHTAGLVKRIDHTTVNAMKNRFLKTPWKLLNQ